jgi:hypothetical protein
MRIKHHLRFSVLLAIIAVSSTAPGAELPDGWFAFPMSGLDASLPGADVSSLNSGPAGQDGFIGNVDGHFADERGRRLRFLGTNLCFGGAFPRKSDADRLAVRMGKLGINVVRIHHIDNSVAPRGIWQPEQKGLDSEQLDRLDWLIAKLKAEGIYVNLNLHVSRTYPGISGDLARAFRYGKALDNFYAPYIRLQKEYARELLAHRNPYTGRPYTAEPAVLCVEINNENSLTTTQWEDLADLPDPWAADLRRQWNVWLASRYQSMEQLRHSWQEIDQPLGAEMLSDANLKSGARAWRLEAPRPAEATLQVMPAGPQPGMQSLLAELTEPGTQSWHFQVNQPGLTLQSDALYSFRFWARSDPPRSIQAEARLAQEPWSHLGLNRSLDLTTEWQEFILPFRATGGEPDSCRVGWVLGNHPGRVWLSGVSLKPGGELGTPKGQSLSQANIDLTRPQDTVARQADFQRFLMETEQRYHTDMMVFLKKELGLRSLVTNTQASYGGLAGLLREATLSEFVDMHGYWQHPRFPGRPWDRSNWYIPNTSMVDELDGGVLGRIALHRVEGKPFTVSEYNHPTPNDHCAEMFPMLASIAAFQDWDAIYQFTYSQSSEQFDRPQIDSYFDLVNHPGQLVWLPIAATIFRTAAVDAGTKPIVLRIPAGNQGMDTRRQLADLWSAAGASPDLPLTRRVSVQLGSAKTAVLSEQLPAADVGRESSGGQISWRPSEQGQQKGEFLVNAPKVRCAIGFLQDRTIDLDDVAFTLNRASNGWASLGLAALDDQPIADSNKMLLVAVGRVGNSGMIWNDERTSVGDQWGDEPTIAEGIGASICLPGTVTVRVLTASGMVSQPVPVQSRDGKSYFEIGPQYQTLWYLVTQQ